MTYQEKLKDPRWQRKRLEVMGRDLFKCRKCGCESKTLSVHHRHYLFGRDPWDYPGELLVTLCDPCHKEEEVCSEILKEMVPSLHFWGYLNTEIRDQINILINKKMEADVQKPGAATVLQ